MLHVTARHIVAIGVAVAVGGPLLLGTRAGAHSGSRGDVYPSVVVDDAKFVVNFVNNERAFQPDFWDPDTQYSYFRSVYDADGREIVRRAVLPRRGGEIPWYPFGGGDYFRARLSGHDFRVAKSSRLHKGRPHLESATKR